MFRDQARAKIETELSRGEAAHRDGFEGRARVCARRAAGAAIHEFLELRSLELAGPSAVDLLAYLPGLIEREGILEEDGAEIKQVVSYLLMRVDESFSLPILVDLLTETRWLIATLEKHT